jgi:hypothetical protein
VISTQDVQQAAVVKHAAKTWSAGGASVAWVSTANVRRAIFSAPTVQVATVGRAVVAVRLAVSVNVALKRRDIKKVILAEQDNTAVLLLFPIRPNFIQPRGVLRVGGGDVLFTSSGEQRRLTSHGERSGTLTTTGT